jgi:hypothetical protein
MRKSPLITGLSAMPNAPRPIADIAFPKWLELTGVDPKHFSAQSDDENAQSSFTLGEYYSTEAAIAIHDCLALDDGELTAQLMLARGLDAFLEDNSFTMTEMLREPEKVQRVMTLCKEIRAVLDSDQMLLRRVEFSEALEAAVSHYGAHNRADVQALIEDDIELAMLRRDALGSLERMRQSQFLKGDAGTIVRPQYSTVIRRWWDIDHLLAAHTAIPEGVSLNLIQPSAEHDMFFCFVVRRGGNLYVLDDAPDYSHPLQFSMSRRPDRALAKRMAKFWFPYQLGNVKVSENGREARVDRDASRHARGLEVAGRYSDFSQIIITVAELPPSELLWTVMMFDLVMDRYWSPAALPELELSYTATQLKPDGQLLLEAAEGAGLPVIHGALGHIAVPDLTVADVASLHNQETAEATLGDTGMYASLRWLEDRYGSHIPQDALNQISSGSDLARLGHDGQMIVLEDPDHQKIESDRFFGRDNALITLNSLDKTHFGTAAQLRADRGFLARHNYAESISAFARQEYDDRHEDVKQWLTTAYAKRTGFLLTLAAAAAADQLKVIDWGAEESPDNFSFENGYKVSFDRRACMGPSGTPEDRGCSHHLGWVTPCEDGNSTFMRYLPQGSEAKRNWKPVCHVTGAKASYYLAFKPTNAIELAWLLGVDRSELPDVLQNHCGLEPDCGNQILNRIDPMLWALHNPWHKLDIGARMGLSKRGLAQLQKQHQSQVDLSAVEGANLKLFSGEMYLPSAVPSPSIASPPRTGHRRR